MSTVNFGTIFNFAEEMEGLDREFYVAAADNPACATYGELFASLAANCKKNIANAQRTRRECVTEMILEPISGLDLATFAQAPADAKTLDAAGALAEAQRLEERAGQFYASAAQRIKALPEGAQGLKTSGKLRARNLKALEAV